MPPTPKATRRPTDVTAKAPASRPHTAPPTTSIGALMQRMTTAPHTLSPQQVYTLQRTVGNRAIAQSLQRTISNRAVTPPLQRQDTPETVVQRERKPKRRSGASRGTRMAKVSIKEGVITSVSFTGTSRPASGRGKQGDHTSAYITFVAMIVNNVRKTEVDDFANTVDVLVRHIQGLSGMQGRWGPYLNDQLRLHVTEPANNLVIGRGMAARMGVILYQLAAIRNQVPGTAVINARSTGGHDESSKHARLKDTEYRLDQEKEPRYSKSVLVKDVWGMFDYHPTKSIKQSTIVSRLAEHISGMAMSYPQAVAHITKSRIFKYLQETHADEVFKKMSTQKASIKKILANVKLQVGV